MKQKILLTTCLLLSSPLAAQQAEHLEWFPVGAEWFYGAAPGVVSKEGGYLHMRVEKDTFYQGKFSQQISKALYYGNADGGVDTIYQDTIYVAELADTVWVYHAINDSFEILYPFYAEVGDTIEIAMYNYHAGNFYTWDVPHVPRYIVEAKGDSILNGRSARYLKLSNNFRGATYLWEGIGWSVSFLSAQEIFDGGGIYMLRCYQFDDYFLQTWDRFACDSTYYWDWVHRESADILEDNLTVIVNGSTTFRLHVDKNIRLSDIRIIRADGRAAQVNGRIDNETVYLELPAGFYVMGFQDTYIKKIIP